MVKTNSIKNELISVIIPAYNEEKSIAFVIKDVLKVSKNYPIEIVVVSDGSKDNTVDVAKKAGAHKVISYKKNQGKGAAFRTGLKNASGKYVVQIDADGQLFASEIPKLIDPLKEGYDVVLGSRYSLLKIYKWEYSFLNLVGNLFFSLAASIVAKRKIVDVMTGFKAFKKEEALKINPTVNHFGYETELVIKAAKKNYKIKNILISCRKRTSGASNVRILKHGVLILKTIVKSAYKN